jgi:hypothetical protein
MFRPDNLSDIILSIQRGPFRVFELSPERTVAVPTENSLEDIPLSADMESPPSCRRRQREQQVVVATLELSSCKRLSLPTIIPPIFQTRFCSTSFLSLKETKLLDFGMVI